MFDCLFETAKETISDISTDFLPYCNNRIVGLRQDNFNQPEAGHTMESPKIGNSG